MEETIKKTQSELGAVIQAPKLTEKLLSRPPFRFIHDIVMAVLKASSFPEDLYTADQLDSAKVTDKKSKLDFLELLIAVVSAGTGKPVAARAAKIAAGEEPEKTNELLQGLAACAGLPAAQKQAAVKKAKGGGAKEPAPAEKAAPAKAPPATKESPSAAAPPAESEEERQKRHEEERRRRHEEKKREKEKEKEKEKAAKAAEVTPEAEAERRRRREEKKREKEAAAAAAAGGGGGDSATATTAASAEPATAAGSPPAAANINMSARKAPPRTKPTHEVIEAQRGVDAVPAANVIREGRRHNAGGADGSDADDDAQDWQKVAAQLEAKPIARTAAVAEDADVKGMLGQQALRAKRAQEAATRGDGFDADAAAASPPPNGGIVIRNSRNTVSRGGGSHALGDGDLHQLREQLQMLTKASNPLGKFLEAIHDDLDSMTRELEMWRSESRNQALAAAEARRQTEESLQEIHANLQNLEDAISDQMQKTNNLRQTILANDAAMEAMMKTIVNPDIAAQ
jgi:TRAF3-interacting protein 1